LSRRRVLLDECIDRRLARKLSQYEVKTVPQMGWAGAKDSEILSKAQECFDVFITVDTNLPYQQNLPAYAIAVLVLHAPTNRLQDHLPLIPAIQEALRAPEPGTAVPIPG